MSDSQFALQYDSVITGPRMSVLYGDCGYFNVGYWADGAAGLVEACDRLVDQLASFVPDDASVIVDVGCGLGAGTCRVQDRFPEAMVIGANISLWQLEQARARGVRAPVVMDAARLAIASGAADAVLAMESPMLFDTRAAFLSEAYRVLRPGGTIALADMLLRERETWGSWMLPEANHVRDPAGYADALSLAGFGEISVKDATASCWRPFCALLHRHFPDWPLENLDRLEESVSHYLMAHARKV